MASTPSRTPSHPSPTPERAWLAFPCPPRPKNHSPHVESDRIQYSALIPVQPRPRDLQKELIHRAMRVMAETAVLAHRRMLEQEWPALFGVALVASVVDRIAAQHRLGVGSVRIMTIRAHHLALADRHVR